MFDAARALLDDVVAPRGMIYKDVVQPFAVARWLAAHPINTIVLQRPLPDVAFAMLASRWYYPATASWLAPDRQAAVLEGLIRAEQALAGIPGVRLRFDDLIDDETALAAALGELYPGADLDVGPYRDDVFVIETRRQLARQGDPRLSGPGRPARRAASHGGPGRRPADPTSARAGGLAGGGRVDPPVGLRAARPSGHRRGHRPRRGRAGAPRWSPNPAPPRARRNADRLVARPGSRRHRPPAGAAIRPAQRATSSTGSTGPSTGPDRCTATRCSSSTGCPASAPHEADDEIALLGGEDSNPQLVDQNHLCCQLHHPRRWSNPARGTAL